MKMKMITLLAAIVLAVLPMTARAQDGSDKSAAVRDKRVTLQVDNADLRSALKLLFQSAGVNYSLDPAVQGTVTVSLADVPFRTALESVLRSTYSANAANGFTYRVEDGVYHVALKPVEAAAPPIPFIPDVEPVNDRKPRVGKINLNWADVRDVIAAFGGSMLPNRLTQQSANGFGGFGNGFGNSFGNNSGMLNNGFGSGMGQGSFFGWPPNNSMVGPFQGGVGFGQGNFGNRNGNFGQGFGNNFGGGFRGRR